MKYQKLQLETILFDNEDIITTSGNNEYTQPPVVPAVPPIPNPPKPPVYEEDEGGDFQA